MKLSVVIPCYNEKGTIREIVKRVDALDINKEIIVVDNVSTDGTRKILEELVSQYQNLRVFFHRKHKGKGAALRTGFKYVKGDVVVVQDADLEYFPQEFNKLLKQIDNGSMIVYGSRIKGRNKMMYFQYYLGNILVSLIANLLYLPFVTDVLTCYKMFRKEVLDNINLRCFGFEFCTEFTAKVRKKGYKICEVPIKYNPRTYEEGKKIKKKDGVIAIWSLLKYRFVD